MKKKQHQPAQLTTFKAKTNPLPPEWFVELQKMGAQERTMMIPVTLKMHDWLLIAQAMTNKSESLGEIVSYCLSESDELCDLASDVEFRSSATGRGIR